MNKITITLTKKQVDEALKASASRLVCKGGQFLRLPNIHINDDGTAEVTAELAYQVDNDSGYGK